MRKIVLAVFLLGLMLIGPTMATASESVAAVRRSEGPIIQDVPTWHFLVDPYIDELWLSFHPDGLVHGYDEAPGIYTAPVLGMWAGGGMLLFPDIPTGIGYELVMLIVSFPNLSGIMYRTIDGLTVDGPYPFQLILLPLETTEASEGSGRGALAAGEEVSGVEPALVGPFTLNPFIDEEWFDMFAPGKINGYADVPGHPSYPAPHLGILAGGMLIFADDYKPGGYELRLNILHLPGAAGISYATIDGITVDGPIDVWLT